MPSSDTPRRRGPFVLPIIPRSHNSLLWAHWGEKHREKQRWKEAVLAIPRGPWWAAGEDYTPAPRKVRLEILVYRKALQDRVNRYASVKYLEDALVERGWAVDDSEEWMDLRVEEKIDRKNTRTEITWKAL